MTEGTALLALGANLGDPIEQLSAATRRLTELGEIGATSSIYRTAPEGGVDQPDYFNAVVQLRTRLSPQDLLQAVLAIEAALGRVRTIPNAPRLLDIDLLAYDDRMIEVPGLSLPHPRMHRRAFVLVPLAEVAPEWRHPALGSTASEMLKSLVDTGTVEYWGELDWLS